MRIYYEMMKNRLTAIGLNNKGVAVVEVILILVVLIGLVVIFKSQALSLVNKIWKTINDNAKSITG